MSRVRRFYGAQPLHLLATVVALAIVAAGIAGWLQGGPRHPRGSRSGRLASTLAFEWILLPLAWVLDRIALAPIAPRVNRAYIRAPALLSGLLLIVFAPLIFKADTPTFEATTGMSPPDYLIRWLLATAVMFAISGLAYAFSLRRSARRQREPGAEHDE